MKKLKQSQYYGIGILVLMLVVFWAVFKVLAPTTFGSPDKLATYMKSALIYAVGGCGLYFICVMGPFDMSVGANIVLSSIIACNASVKFGYAGLVIAPLICGTIIGLINGIVYIKLHISSLIVTCALSLIYEAFSVYATNGKNVILSAGIDRILPLCIYSEIYQDRYLYLCDRKQRSCCKEHGCKCFQI